jgi:phosphoglycolate phosphatase
MRDVTIVFDLDGTLVDTAPDLLGAVDRLLSEKGLPPVPETIIRPLISHGSAAMLRAALAHLKHDLGTPTFDVWWQRYLEIYEERIADRSRPFPGLVDVLERLGASGSRLAVCTNKTEQMSVKLLHLLDLSRHFGAIVGRDTIPGVRKPDPRHLLGTIERAGGDPRRAVMVGDSDVDIAAARAAAIPVIAVSFGYVHAPVATFGPDAVIDSYAEFDAALAAVLART